MVEQFKGKDECVDAEAGEECNGAQTMHPLVLVLVKDPDQRQRDASQVANHKNDIVGFDRDVVVDFLVVSAHVDLHNAQHEESSHEDKHTVVNVHGQDIANHWPFVAVTLDNLVVTG